MRSRPLKRGIDISIAGLRPGGPRTEFHSSECAAELNGIFFCIKKNEGNRQADRYVRPWPTWHFAGADDYRTHPQFKGLIIERCNFVALCFFFSPPIRRKITTGANRAGDWCRLTRARVPGVRILTRAMRSAMRVLAAVSSAGWDISHLYAHAFVYGHGWIPFVERIVGGDRHV